MNDKDKGGSGGAAFEDIWSSILSDKKAVEAGSGDPAPYVHPLVKRASLLSEKSLEICTESLGSETGSDGFSNPLSDPGESQGQDEDAGKNDEEEVVKKNDEVVVVEVVSSNNKYSCPVNNSKKINVGVERSFPPPLPSLVNCNGGTNLHMRTHRRDGRVVVEAVSVMNQNCFRAKRQDGRLLLTFTGDDDEEEEQEQEHEYECEQEKKDDVDEEVDELLTMPRVTGVMNVTRRSPDTVSMSKLIELTGTRSKSTWPRASNMTIIKSLDDDHEEMKELVKVEAAPRKILGHSLPPRPRVSTATAASAATLNAYEYYWRRSNSSPTAGAVTVLKPLAGKQNNFMDSVCPQVEKGGNKRMKKFLLGNNEKVETQEEVVLVGEGAIGEKGEYLVPLFRGCKEPRRSFFLWEPYCIATS
ncbi:hypothetical protein vseg_013055 [Gypsophila vaccaria]